MRGGEKVLEVLCELYPDADIFTLFHHRGSVSPPIERHRIQTSLVQRLPFADAALPPLSAAVSVGHRALRSRARTTSSISSSHCVAKSVIPPRTARATCATAIRRCGMRGISSTRTSAPTGWDGWRAGGSIGRSWRVWPVGCGDGGAGRPLRRQLASRCRRGSPDTIIAWRRWCIHRSTRPSTAPPPFRRRAIS